MSPRTANGPGDRLRELFGENFTVRRLGHTNWQAHPLTVEQVRLLIEGFPDDALVTGWSDVGGPSYIAITDAKSAKPTERHDAAPCPTCRAIVTEPGGIGEGSDG